MNSGVIQKEGFMKITIPTDIADASNVDAIVSTKEFYKILSLLKSWCVERFNEKFPHSNPKGNVE